MHLYEYIFKCVQLRTRLTVLIASMNCISNKYSTSFTVLRKKDYHTAKQEAWVQEREKCRCPVRVDLASEKAYEAFELAAFELHLLALKPGQLGAMVVLSAGHVKANRSEETVERRRVEHIRLEFGHLNPLALTQQAVCRLVLLRTLTNSSSLSQLTSAAHSNFSLAQYSCHQTCNHNY